MQGESSSPDRFTKSTVVYANFAQFGAGQTSLNPYVRSRMVLWCKAGTGSVTVNKNVCSMEAGRCLFLPWGHHIKYEASREDPFLLGGVHIIPEHDLHKAITFDVAHDERHPLTQTSFRRDIEIPELTGLKLGFMDANTPLFHLLEYIVGLFVQGAPEEWMARHLARQLLSEWLRFEQRSEMYDHGVPPNLERMKQFITFRLHQPLSLRDLVEFSQLSPATVGRMFRDHLNTTPVAWILKMKIERAKILLRTRHISVAQVGEQVGIPDPYYFSKCFKKETGIPPREFQNQTVWI